MPSLAHILLPVDFSERSSGAARCARLLSAHFGSTLTVLHVLPPPQYEFGAMDVSGSMLGELYFNRSAQAVRDLAAFTSAELPGIPATPVVVEGDPAATIVSYAHDHGVDLIMMPTHGYGPFRRFILGSNTAKVLHDADCPVWTGVHIAEAPRPVRTCRVRALRGGPGAGQRPDDRVGLLAERDFGARLTLIHAAPACPEGTAAVQAAARRELCRWQKESGAAADLLVESGDPAQRHLRRRRRASAANVLVIGRGSAAGVFGRLRTNAYAIIRQSPCPVVECLDAVLDDKLLVVTPRYRVPGSGRNRAHPRRRPGPAPARPAAATSRIPGTSTGRPPRRSPPACAPWASGKGDIVALNSETRLEFYLADLGIMTNGSIAAAMYPSYPPRDLVRNHRKPPAPAPSSSKIRRLSQPLRERRRSRHWILLTGEAEGAMTLDDLRAMGREALGRAIPACSPGMRAEVRALRLPPSSTSPPAPPASPRWRW